MHLDRPRSRPPAGKILVARQQAEIGLFDGLAQFFPGAILLHHVGAAAEIR